MAHSVADAGFVPSRSDPNNNGAGPVLMPLCVFDQFAVTACDAFEHRL